VRALTQIFRLLQVEWWRIARAIMLGAMTMVCAIGLTAVSAWLIARASQMPPILTLSIAVVGVRAFGVGRGVFRYAERLATHDTALRGMANLRANLYDLLAATPLHANAANPLFTLRRGELLSRVGHDVDEVGNLIVRVLVPAAVSVLVSLGAIALLATMLPSAGLVMLAGLLVTGVVAPWLAYRATASAELQVAAAKTEVSAQSLTLLEDGTQLRVSGRLTQELDRLNQAEHHLAQAEARTTRQLGLANAFAVFAQTATVIVMLALGANALGPGGLLAARPEYLADFGGGLSGRVLLAVIVITPMAVFEATGALPAAAIQLRRSDQSARRLLTLLRPMPDARPWRTFSDLDITLDPGESLAVVGPSGIGKTTLLMTIAGLIPATAGRPQLPSRSLFIGEDDHFFATTILENLRVTRGDVTEIEAFSALTEVGLGDWLATLPDGLDTEFGSDATTISGGERRRLLAARALLSPAEMLLVDEPAEHLDPAKADAVVKALIHHAKATGKVLVIATHRAAEAEMCDRVLRLNENSVSPLKD
jgi:ATP-binding cassette, subfamily C, bacterial CydC